MADHEKYMRLALDNARAMKGQTDPNPLVGAVIVNDNRVVGIGAHLKAGEPHAEIHALRMAGELARGGTIYVTLEPCSHHGRTGPCAIAVAEAGLSRVVIAGLDPNPLVAGRGARMLRDAGIEVITGVCEEEARRMNEAFNKYIATGLPFVTIKAGITLDGKIATASADSKWITSDEARRDAHRLRSENAAILVGVNTVIGDDPELTSRIPHGRNPLRIVLDSSLRIPETAKVVADGKAPTWIFTAADPDPGRKATLERLGVRIIPTGGVDRVDPAEALAILGREQISTVLVEGGGEINASFFERRLVDKVTLYIAPKLIGGRNAPSFLEGNGIERMGDAVMLADFVFEPIGPDIRVTGYPSYGDGDRFGTEPPVLRKC